MLKAAAEQRWLESVKKRLDNFDVETNLTKIREMISLEIQPVTEKLDSKIVELSKENIEAKAKVNSYLHKVDKKLKDTQEDLDKTLIIFKEDENKALEKTTTTHELQTTAISGIKTTADSSMKKCEEISNYLKALDINTTARVSTLDTQTFVQ